MKNTALGRIDRPCSRQLGESGRTKSNMSTWIGAVILACLLPASAVASTVISYDDGTGVGGSAAAYQGVRFTLPGAMTEAHVLAVEFQYNNSSASLTIHFTRDDHVTELTAPVAHTNSSFYEVVNVSARNIIVPKNFYVVLEPGAHGDPVFDSTNDANRSFEGATLAVLDFPSPGDLVLRVTVEAVPPLFADGFESGNTSHWSATVS